MSASPTSAVPPATAATTSASAAAARGASDTRDSDPARDQFGHRLDAARHQQDNDAVAKKHDDERDAAGAQAAPAAVPVAAGKPLPVVTEPTADGKGKDTADIGQAQTAAGALAAMLALLGQPAPVTPSVAATAVAGNLPGATVPVRSLPGLVALTAATGHKPAKGTQDAPGLPIDPLATLADAAPPGAAAVPPPMASERVPSVLDAHRDTDIKDLAAMLPSAPNGTSGGAPVAPHSLAIASPVGTPAFATDMARQITWLGMQDVKQARVRLHPQELGSLDVSISVSHHRVDVSFAVQHPAAVHAVQQSLAQLDSMLAQHGMSLGHTNVGHQQQGRGQSQDSPGMFGTEHPEEGVHALAPLATSGLPGLLDTFA